MATIPLTGKHAIDAHACALVDDDEVADLARYTWMAVPSGTGYVYAVRTWRDGGRKFFEKMHRRIAKASAGLDVDHINRNTLDNRRQNLRVVTHQQNMLNREVMTEARCCRQCGSMFSAVGRAGSVKALYCGAKCRRERDRKRMAEKADRA